LFNYETLKKIIFLFKPETAHCIAEIALRTLPSCRTINNHMVNKNFIMDARLKQEICGINFLNPVGLAAGFDKNGTMIKAMMSMGFAYTEIGTITPRAQDGNPRPRLFRYPKYKSVQNAMGFNNKGSAKILKNLKKVYPFSIPIGANIGKNKTTSQENALLDYKTLIRKFKDESDYLTINISSPNTLNLRDLQNETFVTELFSMAKELTNKPIFLKISPDMKIDTAVKLCNTAVNKGAAGIIATNTTIDYSLIPNCQNFGGLSGACLTKKAHVFFQELAKELYSKTILISAGGISSPQEAYERLKAGASLIQIYTGMIFEGPSMIKNINEGILKLMQKNGFDNISQIIGSSVR